MDTKRFLPVKAMGHTIHSPRFVQKSFQSSADAHVRLQQSDGYLPKLQNSLCVFTQCPSVLSRGGGMVTQRWNFALKRLELWRYSHDLTNSDS